MSNKAILLIACAVPIIIGAAFGFVYFTADKDVFINPQNNTISIHAVQTEPGIPVRLIIPGINVDAPIIKVGLTSAGALDTPEGPIETAWYQLGPRPGAQGSSVITGHFGPWQNGSGSVFDNLTKLKVGDNLQVKDDAGTTHTFVVTGTKVYKPNESAPEVFNSISGSHLNIITCHGTWLASQKTYNQRYVVFTDLVE